MQEVFHKLDSKPDSLWSNFKDALGDNNIDIFKRVWKNC